MCVSFHCFTQYVPGPVFLVSVLYPLSCLNHMSKWKIMQASSAVQNLDSMRVAVLCVDTVVASLCVCRLMTTWLSCSCLRSQ
jgi:hypothetical protein